MIDYQEIGNNIKICRIRCNLKQAELAEMVGVTSQHISHVERCQTKPSLTLLVDISTALRVDLYTLLGSNIPVQQPAADFLVRFCEGRDCMDKQQREYIHHLMLQYSDAMVRLTYRRVGVWHLAEDLVQETFLTACCKSERVCGHKKPVAWLFETLNNLTLRESRRFYHTEVSIEDIAESYELTELPMACHIPMGLSGSEQEIILLRIDKGYSFLELAEHFGISEMACRQRLSRALHKCRTLLEEPLGSTPK